MLQQQRSHLSINKNRDQAIINFPTSLLVWHWFEWVYKKDGCKLTRVFESYSKLYNDVYSALWKKLQAYFSGVVGFEPATLAILEQGLKTYWQFPCKWRWIWASWKSSVQLPGDLRRCIHNCHYDCHCVGTGWGVIICKDNQLIKKGLVNIIFNNLDMRNDFWSPTPKYGK